MSKNLGICLLIFYFLFDKIELHARTYVYIMLCVGIYNQGVSTLC